jgi:N-methylhydantoinase B/oxoprolinase/acetone carboxylase alpha subunit
VRHIIEGLREHRVPDEYIVDVKAAACANNSGISTEVNAL